MRRLRNWLALGLVALILLSACSLDDVFDAMDSMGNNVMGTPDVSISAIMEIADETSLIPVISTSSYDEDSDTTLVSIVVTGVLSTAFDLEGDYSFEDATYYWLTSLDDDDLITLAEILEDVSNAGGSSKLVSYLNETADATSTMAVNSTSTFISDMLSDFDVSQLELEDETMDQMILDLIDAFSLLAEGEVTYGEMLIMRLISTDVISVLKDSATQLYIYQLYGLNITAIDQDGLIDIFKDSADYLLQSVAVALSFADLICDTSDFAKAFMDLYDYAGDYITDKVED